MIQYRRTKANLKKALGRKLAARVLKSWVEDFVDEDTGEVVSIERNEVLLDRETTLEDISKTDIKKLSLAILYGNKTNKNRCRCLNFIHFEVDVYRQIHLSQD